MANNPKSDKWGFRIPYTADNPIVYDLSTGDLDITDIASAGRPFIFRPDTDGDYEVLTYEQYYFDHRVINDAHSTVLYGCTDGTWEMTLIVKIYARLTEDANIDYDII